MTFFGFFGSPSPSVFLGMWFLPPFWCFFRCFLKGPQFISQNTALFKAYLSSFFFYSATYLLCVDKVLQVAKAKQQEKRKDTRGGSGTSLFYWREPYFGTGCLLTTRVRLCWPRVRAPVKQAGDQECTIFDYGSKHTGSAMSVMLSLSSSHSQQQIVLQGISLKKSYLQEDSDFILVHYSKIFQEAILKIT